MPSVITHNIGVASASQANNISAATSISREQSQLANQKTTQESIQNVAVKVSVARRRDVDAPVQSPARVEGGYGPKHAKSRATRHEHETSGQTDLDSPLDTPKV